MFHFLIIVNDTLDEMLGESGDEEESDNIVTQVLDEIGIEISGKVKLFIIFLESVYIYVVFLLFSIDRTCSYT